MTAPARHVLYLADMLDGVHGGTEGQLDALLRRLPQGWKASLWVLQRANALAREAFPVPIRALELPRLRSPVFAARLRSLARAVRAANVDVIHGVHADTSMVAPLLGVLAGVPVITSRRDLGYWQTPHTLEILRRADRYADLIVANAEAVSRHTVEVEHALPSQLRVIPNGHPAERFDVERDPRLREELGIPADAPVIGLLANFRALKRPQDLVDALAALGDAHGGAHLLFIGTGYRRSSLDLRGLADRVHVHGVLGDVVPVLKHFDAGVLCSESEGLSNAIIEYMACGLPVVATRAGGNPELVAEGETGRLYDVGDVPALAAALDGLLSDPAEGRRLGAAGRARFEERFRVDRMVADTVACYRELVDAPPAAPPALRWELVEDLPALEALDEPWRRLLGPRQFFVGPDWVCAWLRSQGVRPCVPVARDARGELAGLLPLAQTQRGLVSVCGLGLGADHIDVVAADGRAMEVARGALACLDERGLQRLRLHHVSEDSALRAVLRAAKGRRPYGERLSTTCPYLAVESDWETYLRGHFRPKSRKNFTRHARRFLERPGARIRRVTDAGDVDAGIDLLFDLHARRFAQLGQRSSFQGDAVRAFHKVLARRLAARGDLCLAFLETDAGPAAGLYGFRSGSRLLYFQAGMADPDGSPGEVLRTLVMRDDVFGAGLEEFDFLDGGEPFKLRWATGARRLFDLEVHPPGWRGRLGSTLRGITALARREVARRLRRRP